MVKIRFKATSVLTSETNDIVNSVMLTDSRGEYLDVGEWLTDSGRKGLRVIYGDESNVAENCVESLSVKKEELELTLSKPIRNFPKVNAFCIKLDLPAAEYEDLRRALTNLFRRYDGILQYKV